MHRHASFLGMCARRGFAAGVAARLGLLIVVASLLFGSGCSDSGSKPPFPVTGGFTNASLKGRYAFTLSGTRVVANNGLAIQGQYQEGGVFTADGNGSITAGSEDLHVLGVFPGFTSAVITGFYSISQDGNGSITLNVGGGTETWNITMVSSSKFYLTEADSSLNFSANASGTGEQQDATVLTQIPSGTFAFRVHQNLPTLPSSAMVGQFSSTIGSTTGQVDTEQSGVLSASPQTLSGTFTALDNAGRGSFQATIGGLASSFNYYIVNATTVLLLESDSNALGIGRAEAQSLPFSAHPLIGAYTFGSSGDTQNDVFGVNSAGTLSVTGTALSGTYDSNRDGLNTANQALTGTINSFDPTTGRATVSFTPSGTGVAIQEVWYLVNPSRAFSLIYYPNLPTITEDGTLEQQTGGPFSTSSLNGQYAFLMGGYINSGKLTRVGTFIPDGSGTLNIKESTNVYFSGTTTTNPSSTVNSPSYINGTKYTVDASGRVAASTTNLLLYMVSPGNAYVVQTDSGAQMFGRMELQH